jgi:cell division protein FtsQ
MTMPPAGPPPPVAPRQHPRAARQPARPARRRARPWRAAFLVVPGILIVLGAAWALLGSSLLVVQVSGNGGVPVAQIRAAADIRPGTPLARLDEVAVARRVERIPRVLSARVGRSWPDTVMISVRRRTPALAVAVPGGYALIDVHGVMVAQAPRRPAGMPLLDAPPARLRGSPAVRAGVLVLDSLPAPVRARVTAVTAPSAGQVTLRLRGGITVAWGSAARGPAKVRELTALLRTRARYIDVSAPGVAVTGR